MPETKSKQRPAQAKRAAVRKPSAAQPKSNAKGAARRTTELSDDVFASLDETARSAVDAVRKFTETVDRALPLRGEGPSRREEIMDSALEMAQRLVHTQAEFLRKVVDSAGRSLSGPRKGK